MAAARIRAYTAVLLAAALGVASCSEDPDHDSQGTPPKPPSTTASSPTSSPGTSMPADQAPEDRLAPVPADISRGFMEGPSGFNFLRAENGSTLVKWDLAIDYDRAQYRIYDAQWRPVTPLLDVPVGLELARGLGQSFVAQATVSRRSGMGYVLREWVIIRPDGSLRVVPHQPSRGSKPLRMRAEDARFLSPFTTKWAYRPSTQTVFVVKTPRWDAAEPTWSVTDRGTFCVNPRFARIGDLLRTSVDEGRTLIPLRTDGVLPADSGPRIQSCKTTTSRVVVMTGGEYPLWLHTLDRASGSLLSSIRLGDKNGDTIFSGYAWTVLPDGRLVFEARRPGLLVATDNSNQEFRYQPGPTWLPEVVDDELFNVAGATRLDISRDAGSHWRRIDLQMPPRP